MRVQLDAPLPGAVAVGAGTALFVAGWCVPPQGRIVALEFLDGQPLTEFGMPRLDVYRALGGGSYASGFWGTLRVAVAPVTVGLRATLDDGTVLEEVLGEVAEEALPAPLDGAPRVAICMATYEPDPELFARQLDSIRAQTVQDWVCIVSDDGSRTDVAALVGDDPRFVVSRSPRRQGFYRNFERALALAPAGASFVALADQDDAWYPDKLETLLGAIGDAELAYSDARVVDEAGAVLAGTYWRDRDNNHDDLRSLLAANAVTGAASLLRRDLLDVALPFPPAQFAHFHDHWLALCARTRGEIAYVDRPLYDYVQHGSAVLGHAAANRVVGLRARMASLRHDPRDRIRLYRSIYFVDVARLTQMATILLARIPGSPRRRVLEDFLAADRSPARAARLWLAGAREYAGRPETLGAERGLAYAFAWRQLLRASARARPQRRLRLDAVPPADLAPRPGATRPEGPARVVAEKIAPLRLTVAADGPARVNLLLPTIDLDHLFGGYIGKFNLARRLAERGARVRIVTVDPTPPLPADWRGRVSAYAGLAGVFDRVEVAFGREGGLEVGPGDRFVATTWWTAHIAAAAVREAGLPRFAYLVQEYEPFTFPQSTWGALAEQSYRFEHAALYSTELLQEWFVARALAPAEHAAFRNAITASVLPAQLRNRRRLLFYARPEPHAARNLFELGVLALARAAASGALAGWSLRGIGTTSLGRRLAVGGGAELELLPRTAQGDYARVLADHDVGLALMHTPHPSLVPLEMAAAGMVAVTSAFENKTPAALAAISPNLVVAEPTVAGVADALAAAVARADDVAARRAGAAVDWPTDWAAALPDALMDRVLAWLR